MIHRREQRPGLEERDGDTFREGVLAKRIQEITRIKQSAAISGTFVR